MRLLLRFGLAGLLCLLTLMSRAQDVTPPADLISDTPTSTATASWTPTLSPTSTDTPSLEPTMTETASASPSLTLTLESASPTLSPTLESSSVETTSEATSELQTTFFTVTITDPLLTEAIEPAMTAPVVTSTASVSPTFILAPIPTETTEISMVLLAGKAIYQNHGSDHSGIQISAFDVHENLIGVTQTDANGQFTLTIPGQVSYQLVFEASLHRRIQVLLTGNESLPDFVMTGGDLDADGCIGQLDMDLFMTLFNSSNSSQGDITGDGWIDASDFAILAGNYDNSCASIEPTPIDDSLPISLTLSPTLMESTTPEILLGTPTETSTIVDVTVMPSLEATSEVTE